MLNDLLKDWIDWVDVFGVCVCVESIGRITVNRRESRPKLKTEGQKWNLEERTKGERG